MDFPAAAAEQIEMDHVNDEGADQYQTRFQTSVEENGFEPGYGEPELNTLQVLDKQVQVRMVLSGFTALFDKLCKGGWLTEGDKPGCEYQSTKRKYSNNAQIVLDAEAVKNTSAGDRCELTGTPVVGPNVEMRNLSDAQTESDDRHRRNGQQAEEVVRGMETLEVMGRGTDSEKLKNVEDLKSKIKELESELCALKEDSNEWKLKALKYGLQSLKHEQKLEKNCRKRRKLIYRL